MLRISTHYKLYEENETWYGFKGRPKIKNQHYKINLTNVHLAYFRVGGVG